MDPARGDGQTAIAQAGAEHHRSPGHKPVLRQHHVLPGQQLTLPLTRKAEALPQSLLLPPVLLVDNIRIGENQGRLWMGREFLLAALQAIGIPDIVLVAKRDQIPIAKANGALEVGGRSEIVLILENPNGIGSG